MDIQDRTVARRQASVLSTNKVLRNTYMLLGLTLIFSGLCAAFSVATNAPYPGMIIAIVGMYGLLFLTQALRNSAWGLLATFAFTGFMGYILGPLLNFYLHSYSNGGELIATALGTTGIVFFALSAYALTTRKDFSYLGGFIFIAVITAVILMLASLFLHMPMINLIISALFVLISSAVILFQTSLIINGGERNYIMATISLYVAIYNLFVSLLQLLGAFSGRDNN